MPAPLDAKEWVKTEKRIGLSETFPSSSSHGSTKAEVAVG